MTDEQIAEIEARAEAATPGPWEVVPEDPGSSYDVGVEVAWPLPDGFSRDAERVIARYVRVYPECAIDMDRDDAAFIAHARTDIPALIAALREARAELERVRGMFSEEDARTLDSEVGNDIETGELDPHGGSGLLDPDALASIAARIRQVIRGEAT